MVIVAPEVVLLLSDLCAMIMSTAVYPMKGLFSVRLAVIRLEPKSGGVLARHEKLVDSAVPWLFHRQAPFFISPLGLTNPVIRAVSPAVLQNKSRRGPAFGGSYSLKILFFFLR